MRFFAFIFIIFCLSACHINSKRINNPADKEEAELTTERFYAWVSSEQYQPTFDLFSKKFYEVTDANQLLHLYDTARTSLGELMKWEINSWETTVVVGTNSQSVYKFVYNVRYSRFDALETFTLTKDPDGKIKIVSYYINSDGFTPPDRKPDL